VTANVLRALFDVVGREVAAGNTIFVTNFGTWKTREEPFGMRRNPQTGEWFPQAARQVPKFVWAPAIRAAVAAGVLPKTLRKKRSH
jgi:DNA-binding protein HU-beta